MIVFDVSESRFRFMEYLKSTNLEYSPELFLKFLSGSLFRICGLTVEPFPVQTYSNTDLLVTNISQFDVILTKWLPMDYMGQLRSSGFVGDYYFIKIVGNSGVIFHVNESGAVHNTIQ